MTIDTSHKFDELFSVFVENIVKFTTDETPEADIPETVDEDIAEEISPCDWVEEKTKLFVDGLPFAKIVTCGNREAILIGGEVIFLEDDSLVEPLVNVMRRGHSELQSDTKEASAIQVITNEDGVTIKDANGTDRIRFGW